MAELRREHAAPRQWLVYSAKAAGLRLRVHLRGLRVFRDYGGVQTDLRKQRNHAAGSRPAEPRETSTTPGCPSSRRASDRPAHERPTTDTTTARHRRHFRGFVVDEAERCIVIMSTHVPRSDSVRRLKNFSGGGDRKGGSAPDARPPSPGPRDIWAEIGDPRHQTSIGCLSNGPCSFGEERAPSLGTDIIQPAPAGAHRLKRRWGPRITGISRRYLTGSPGIMACYAQPKNRNLPRDMRPDRLGFALVP